MDFIKSVVDWFLDNVYNVPELIRWVGFPGLIAIVFAETGLLVGFFLPGDSLLITAGVFAAGGLLDIRLLVPVLILAAIAGNATGYAIGKRTGKALYNRPDSFLFRREHLRMTHEYYEKHGGKTIVDRAVHSHPADVRARRRRRGRHGLHEVRHLQRGRRHLWVGSMTLAGYALGNLCPNIEQRIHYVVAVVIALSLLPPGIAWLRRRKTATWPRA